MKQLFIILLVLIGYSASSQVKVTQDANGNYIAVKSQRQSGDTSHKPTGKTFTDTKGTVYPVYESSRGKLFVIRTSRNGNQYKQYLNK